MTQTATQYDLEEMVDGASLAEVLSDLAEICSGKASHLAENWQDESAAKIWEEAGKLLDKVSHQTFMLGV